MPMYKTLTNKEVRNNNFLRKIIKNGKAQILLRNHSRNRQRLKCIPFEKSRDANPETVVHNWGIEDLGIKDIWDTTKGKDIKVAVLDTGITPYHVEFGKIDMEKRELYENFVGSSNGVKDTVGHGTLCAGIIGANNTKHRYIGIAPEATLMIGKVAIGDYVNPISLSYGIKWAANNGAHIISISMGSLNKHSLVKAAINHAIRKGSTIICAAGDCRSEMVSFPARYENTFAVGAVGKDENEKLVPACGTNSTKLDFVAPGVEITTTTNVLATSDDVASNGYGTFDGTSSAAPFLAGVVALLYSKLGNTLPHSELMELLKKSTRDETDIHSKTMGWGVVNPKKLFASL